MSEAEEPFSRVNGLCGLLSICAYCGRIRKDDNNWEPLDGDVSVQARSEISHGICPACYKRVQREIDRL